MNPLLGAAAAAPVAHHSYQCKNKEILYKTMIQRGKVLGGGTFGQVEEVTYNEGYASSARLDPKLSKSMKLVAKLVALNKDVNKMAGSLKLFLRYGSPEMSAMYVNLDKTGSQYLHPILDVFVMDEPDMAYIVYLMEKLGLPPSSDTDTTPVDLRQLVDNAASWFPREQEQEEEEEEMQEQEQEPTSSWDQAPQHVKSAMEGLARRRGIKPSLNEMKELRLPWSMITALVMGLLRMSNAMEDKMLHRDLKLENIGLVFEPMPKGVDASCMTRLEQVEYGCRTTGIDLGMIKVLDPTSVQEEQMTIAIGTPSTMAPEVMFEMLVGGQYDASCDKFSMGQVLLQAAFKDTSIYASGQYAQPWYKQDFMWQAVMTGSFNAFTEELALSEEEDPLVSEAHQLAREVRVHAAAGDKDACDKAGAALVKFGIKLDKHADRRVGWVGLLKDYIQYHGQLHKHTNWPKIEKELVDAGMDRKQAKKLAKDLKKKSTKILGGRPKTTADLLRHPLAMLLVWHSRPPGSRGRFSDEVCNAPKRWTQEDQQFRKRHYGGEVEVGPPGEQRLVPASGLAAARMQQAQGLVLSLLSMRAAETFLRELTTKVAGVDREMKLYTTILSTDEKVIDSKRDVLKPMLELRQGSQQVETQALMMPVVNSLLDDLQLLPSLVEKFTANIQPLMAARTPVYLQAAKHQSDDDAHISLEQAKATLGHIYELGSLWQRGLRLCTSANLLLEAVRDRATAELKSITARQLSSQVLKALQSSPEELLQLVQATVTEKVMAVEAVLQPLESRKADQHLVGEDFCTEVERLLQGTEQVQQEEDGEAEVEEAEVEEPVKKRKRTVS